MDDLMTRVLSRVERVCAGLRNATVGVKGANVSLPRTVIEHHADVLGAVCADLRGAEGPPDRQVSAGVKHRVILAAWSEDRGGYLCTRCGELTPRDRLHVDHVEPLARGGSNARPNLVALCATCNLAKGAQSR